MLMSAQFIWRDLEHSSAHREISYQEITRLLSRYYKTLIKRLQDSYKSLINRLQQNITKC